MQVAWRAGSAVDEVMGVEAPSGEPRVGPSTQREGTNGTDSCVLSTWTAWMVHLYLSGQGSQLCDLLTLSILWMGSTGCVWGELELWRGGYLRAQRQKGDQVSFLSSWTPDCRSGMRKAPLSHTCKMLHKIPGKKRSRKAHNHSREQSPLSKGWSPVGLRSMSRSWCL